MIVLSGEPKSTSHIYKIACRGTFPTMYLSQEGKNIRQAYQYQAKAQWRKKPLTGPLQVTIALYHGTKRKSDWDNFHKLSMDALTGIVWADDSQIQEANVRRAYDPKKPRIEIEINSLP